MEVYVKQFKIGGFDITSVVMDADEFEKSLADLAGVVVKDLRTGAGISDADRQTILTNGVFVIARGTKTQFMFDRYKVSSNTMSVCRRGLAKQVMGL